jgi:outer membrane protein TolC
MKRLVILLFLLAPALSRAQGTLDSLLRAGLDSNLGLRQQSIALERSFAALREARGLFLPSLSLLADYTYADGGRKIDIPVGDLMNPVYSTLNQLTQSNAFPQIANVSEQFLPNDFHDTRLRLALPLINAEIWYNEKIRREAYSGQQAALAVYKRELVKDIRTAYYQFLRADQAVAIYTNAAKLLQDNRRLTETLVGNGLALRSNLLKIDAEIAKNEAARVEAENNRTNALRYLNFLLNRPLDTPIATDSTALTAQPPAELNGGRREELAQLESGIRQNQYLVRMKRGYLLPTVNTFFDAGYQGFYYRFDDEQQYYLGGVQLRWNLFAGMTNTRKVQQAEAGLRELESKRAETEKQLELQTSAARLSLQTAQVQVTGAEAQERFASEYYRQTLSRYREGQALVLELTDAFTQWTNNRLALNAARASRLIRQAELERALAAYTF